jgi:hypothetical protein
MTFREFENGHMKDLKTDLREISNDVRRSVELAQDRVQWQAVVLALLNISSAAAVLNEH